jgi:tetratricopeptide (TPR) repeat protein
MNSLIAFFFMIISLIQGWLGMKHASPLPTFEDQQKQQEIQQAWDTYYLLTYLRTALHQHQFENQAYPTELTDLDPDYITYPPDFDFSQFTYTIDSKTENYTICLKQPPQPDLCITKDTLLPEVTLTPEMYAIEKPLDEELYLSLWDSIRSSQGDRMQLNDALLAIAHWKHLQPDSIEFKTLYAWYLLEEGHVYSNEYYPETLSQVRRLTKEAAASDPDNLQVLLLESTLAWHDNKQSLATAKERQMKKLYPDNDMVILETIYSASPATNVSFLEDYLSKETKSVYLRKSAYQALITAYKALGKDDKVVETYERKIAEYNHPWDYQGLGLYWLRENECEKAIEVFNDGLKASEIGMIRHVNLPQAYAICAHEYATKGELDTAIEYMQIAVDTNQDLPDCECSAEYMMELGDFLYKRGRQDKSSADLEKAIGMYESAAQENPLRKSTYDSKKRLAEIALKKLGN